MDSLGNWVTRFEGKSDMFFMLHRILLTLALAVLDGPRSSIPADGRVTLTHGAHLFRLDYYQGPRWFLELRLQWQHEGLSSFEIIGKSYFHRPNKSGDKS